MEKGIIASRLVIADKSPLDCVFCWTSCHVWFLCTWVHSQTDRCARDGSGGSSVVARNAEVDAVKLC